MSHLAPIIACVAWFGPFWLALASSTAVAGDTDQQPAPSATDWHYGAFVDGGFAKDFTDPVNHLFRSRGTTPRVDEVDLNMAAAYVRRIASASSPWGLEITGQAGQDSKAFGFSPTAPNAASADWVISSGRP